MSAADDDIWPLMPEASWPSGGLIEGMAVHPQRPWLAAACTNAVDEGGALLLFDAETGTLRSSTAFESYVGWADDPKLLRWHPDGERLTTNVDTNGIALLRRAAIVGFAYPDETRDHGVRHVWVDDRIFADTGVLFEIREGEAQFEFESLTSLGFGEIEWNAAISAVVGTTHQGIAAFDPIRETVVHETRFEAPPWHSGRDWSADGRWYARRRWGQPGASDEIMIYRGDDGGHESTFVPSLPSIKTSLWGPGGSLLVHCESLGQPRASALDIVRDGQIARRIDLGPRRIEASHSLPDALGLAWSPAGDGIALLLDGQEIGILDAHTGRMLISFPAPAPAIPPELPDWYRNGHRPNFGFPGDLSWVAPHRLVRIAPHFVSVWSIDGQKIAEFVVP
jgi:hypothetical protein